MNEDTFGASFLDIATNTLAIVMIVTMFALLTVESETAVQRDPRFNEQPLLALRIQPPLTERPFLDYYLVFDGRIIRWEQERYVAELISSGLGQTIALPGGKLRVTAVMEPRDPDSFSASFAPDFSTLVEKATPLTSDTLEAVTDGIVDRRNTAGLAPNFIVYPSGMDGFELLYRSLREEPIWMRWFLWSEDAPLKIERRVAHFTRFEFDF
ncbi:MAG: hypothetical protein OXC69_02765 [Candidatus Tectomicrobia bacterium]|nr:hypothetical protein [Candidatus Tectomicrobia bacterium]